MKRMWFLLLFICIFPGDAFPEGKWTLYSTGTAGERITALAIEGDFLWAGTDSGVVKLNRTDGASVRYTTKDGLYAKSISAIAVDHNGVKWFGQGDTSGISSFDNTVFKTYTKGNTPAIARYDSLHNMKWGFSIDDIVVDPENTVLFTGSGRWQPPESGGWLGACELFIYQNNTWKIREIGGKYGNSNIYHLAVDTANPDTLWYCGNRAGYFVKPYYTMDYNDKRFYPYFFSGNAITMDKNDNVWYGGSKIHMFNRRAIKEFSTEVTGIINGISTVTVDKNNVKWFGSSLGITRYDGHAWKTYAPDGWNFNNDTSYSDWVTCLAIDDDGVLWAGTNKGLYRFEETPTAVQDAAPKAVSVAITGISPNPFNPSTTISFTLPVTGRAVLTVYDITGRKVRTLVSEHMSAGTHSVVWDGKDARGVPVSSGVYLSRLESAKVSCTAKMLLMK